MRLHAHTHIKRWRQRLTIALLTLAALANTQCDRRDIELYYDHKADVRLTFDWLSRYGERPNGMTLLIAGENDQYVYTDVTNDVDGMYVKLPPGTYKLTAFNRSYGEYGSMSFLYRESYTNLSAKADSMQTYAHQQWDQGIAYLQEPEQIGVAVDTFTVEPDWVDSDLKFTDYREPGVSDTTHVVIPETVYPMTTVLYVRVKLINMQYMANVSGNISGMADGFLLSQIWRRNNEGYHLLDSWQRVQDPDHGNTSWITTSVRTFGLPHGRELLSQREESDNVLTLNITLLDGRQLLYRFNVGKMIHYLGDTSELNEDDGKTRADEGLRHFDKLNVTLELELVLEAGIELPYAEGDIEGASQFDADVDPWGDEETHQIGL